MNTAYIEVTRAHWHRLEPEILEHSRRIWATPELPQMEFEACELLASWLERGGFVVTRGVCGIPTAFKATYQQGPGPRIALLAEYDALPGTDNDATSYRKRLGRNAGHACGHNHIGAANVGAALAARNAMIELELSGEIVVLGTPSEEITWGKIAMLDLGAFDDLDILLTSHGDDRNGVASQPCMSVVSGEFMFSGVSTHGGSPSKQNALDAVELAVQTVERLRAHHFSDTNVEHVLRAAGNIPNVTPDETRLWISVRQPNYERAKEVYDFVAGVCEQVATTTGTKFKEQFISGTRGYLANHCLADVVYRNLQLVGPPKWTDEHIQWFRELALHTAPDGKFTLPREVGYFTDGCDFYGQDDGEASWRIPLARINWAVPSELPFHNWAVTAVSGHRAGEPGPLMASEALALSTVDLLQDPRPIAAAKTELLERVDKTALTAPAYGAFRTMTEEPERFWNADWIE